MGVAPRWCAVKYPAASALPQALAWRCFSLTPTAHGREEPTKTPTDSSATTYPKGPPSPATNPTSTPSPTSRATAPEPPSATEPQQKHSTNSSLPPIDTAHHQLPTPNAPHHLRPRCLPPHPTMKSQRLVVKCKAACRPREDCDRPYTDFIFKMKG